MPAGEPVLGSSRGHRQLLGHDLKNSNASSGHARDCSPTPGRRARRSPLRPRPPARASATTAGNLWRCDLCPETSGTYHLGHMS